MFKSASIWANIIAIAAAFAAVLQWSVPHGWMLSEDASGGIILTPCPSTSPELIAIAQGIGSQPASVDHSQHDHAALENGSPMSAHHAMGHVGDDNSQGSAEALCDFAAFGAPALLSFTPALSAPPIAKAYVPLFLLSAIPGRGLAAPPPPSTGPPSLIA